MRFRVTGRVIDREGRPIPGAELVRVEPPRATLAVSDARGHFQATAELPPRASSPEKRPHRIDALVLAEGYAAGQVFESVSEGGWLDLGEIVLGPGSVLVGRVLGHGGRGVEGAVVVFFQPLAIRDEGTGRMTHTYTEEGGRYRLLGVPLQPGTLVAWYEGTGSKMVSIPAARDPEPRTQDLVLEEPVQVPAIRGQVLRPDGRPLAGAEVVGLAGGDRVVHRTQADEDGRFELALDPDWPFDMLEARDPERVLLPARTASQAGQDHRLTLSTGRWIEVRLVDPDGEVIPWGHLRALGAQPPLELTAMGETGILRLLLPTEPFHLEALAWGYRTVSHGPFDPAALGERLDLHLEPGQALWGRVTAGGRPVAGASIRVGAGPDPESLGLVAAPPGGTLDDPFDVRMPLRTGPSSVRSDEQGRFVAPLYRDGWHVISVEADGNPWTVVGPFFWEMEPGVAGVEVELPPAGALEGFVLAPPGEDPGGRLVAVSNGWGQAWTERADERGYYRFENLAPGDWQVRAAAPPAPSQGPLQTRGIAPEDRLPRWDARVEAGTTARFDLDLTVLSTCRLEGRITIDGEPLASREISVLRGEEWPHEVAKARTEPDGSFALGLRRPGPVRLAFRVGTARLRLPLDLREGAQRCERDLVTGRLELNLSGSPAGLEGLRRLSLSVAREGDAALIVETEATARIEDLREGLVLPSLPEGPYAVHIVPIGFGARDVDWPDPPVWKARVEAGEIVDVVFP